MIGEWFGQTDGTQRIAVILYSILIALAMVITYFSRKTQ